MESSMIFSIILSFLTFLCKSEVIVPPEHHFMPQQLDHFDETNNKTWIQKFYVLLKYGTDHDVPNILGLVDGNTVQAHFVQEGLWYNQARDHRTNLFVTDLRFFGFNRPTEDLSDENLKYFTIEQIVEDIYAFIQRMHWFLSRRDSFHKHSEKWIIQGCGLAGAVATLFRIKYPDLVAGVVALRTVALVPIMENPGFFENVVQSLREESPKCVANIREGFRQMDSIVNSTSGAQEIGDSFEICSSIEDQKVLRKKDVFTLTFLMVDFYAASVKARGHLQDVKSVRDVCALINNESKGSEFARLALVHESLRSNMNQYCTPLYKDYVNRIKDVSYTAQKFEFLPNLRLWKYLECFEQGIFRTSKNVQDAFYGDCFNLTFFQGVCKDAFPTWTLEKLEKKIASNKKFLEANLPNLTNVVFVHEKSDPYRSVYYRTRNEKSYNIDITGTGNCAILREERVFDPSDVKMARKKLSGILSKWSAEYKS